MNAAVGVAAFWSAALVAAVLTLDTVVSLLIAWVAQLRGVRLDISVWKVLASITATVVVDLGVAWSSMLLR